MSVIEAPHEKQVEAPNELTLRDVLLKTAHRIEEYGWAQGTSGNGRDAWTYYGPDGGGNCVLNSAVETTGFPTWSGPIAEALGLDSPSDVYRWNDTPGRTAEEVVAALREAADRA